MGERARKSDLWQRKTGKAMLKVLIGEHSSSPHFVRGITDAARLQSVKARTDGRREILTKALYGINHDPTGVLAVVYDALDEDVYYHQLQRTQNAIERRTRAANQSGDADSRQYYEGFRQAQRVLTRYVGEDRISLINSGGNVSSLYQSLINGTTRFVADFSELTGTYVAFPEL